MEQLSRQDRFIKDLLLKTLDVWKIDENFIKNMIEDKNNNPYKDLMGVIQVGYSLNSNLKITF